MAFAKPLLPLSCLCIAALTACGGGDPTATPLDTAADVQAQPSFHRLPLALAEPDESDADGGGASAQQEPQAAAMPAEWQGLGTRGLTDEKVQAWRDAGRASALSAAHPNAAASNAVVYTPAQIRSAYRLPSLPANTSGLDAATAASLGAGQTIFVIAAYNHPNAIADLAAFNKKFGLPNCISFSMAPGATALAAANASAGCTVAVVAAAANATVGSKLPAYSAGWAQEIALDMQWAHATAPLARIVLIEAADANTSTLNNAVALANRLGPGIVTMSFGTGEGSFVNANTSIFQGSGMSYLAATGDSGYGVSWPAVVPTVLAVGGTKLLVSGSSRSESAWSLTGGGISSIVAMPAYQSPLTIAGEPASAKKRAVADVAFNADPNTGQYVAFTPNGASQPNWYAFGGTSLATPQWAGLLAVANAQRSQRGAGLLGAPHALLYSRFAPGSSNYAAGFFDINAGSNGSCAACSARAGFDAPTGLGAPRGDALLPLIAAR